MLDLDVLVRTGVSLHKIIFQQRTIHHWIKMILKMRKEYGVLLLPIFSGIFSV